MAPRYARTFEASIPQNWHNLMFGLRILHGALAIIRVRALCVSVALQDLYHPQLFRAMRIGRLTSELEAKCLVQMNRLFEKRSRVE